MGSPTNLIATQDEWRATALEARVEQELEAADASVYGLSRMRRRLSRLVIASTLLVPLLSCGGTSKSESATTQPTPTSSSCSFAISPQSAAFASTGGSETVKVTATPAGCAPAGWTATATAGLTVSPSSGSGAGSVTVSAAANGKTSEQTATATIAGQVFTASVAALASAYTFSADGPDLGNDTWNASADNGDRWVTVTVTPNDGSCAAWKAVASANWISAEPASGTTSGAVQIEYDRNDAATGRSASVSFTRPGCSGANCGLTVKVNQAARPTFTLNLTLQQGHHLSGPYAGTATGPNGFSCAITQREERVTCPPATFANGTTVALEVKQTTVAGDGNIFVNNTFGCDTITRAANGTGICTVKMNADRDVVIGVGCSLLCAGLDAMTTVAQSHADADDARGIPLAGNPVQARPGRAGNRPSAMPRDRDHAPQYHVPVVLRQTISSALPSPSISPRKAATSSRRAHGRDVG